MQLKLPADGRPLALVLLLVVVLVLYFALVHWWFVAPQIDIARQMTDMREQQQRFAAIVAQRDEIQQRLDAVRAYEQNNQAFLPETDPAAASAALIQRVTDAIRQRDPDGNRCSAQQSTPLQRPASGEPYMRVSVRVRLTCDIEPLTALLHELEQGKPFLFVDELMLYQQATFYQRTRPSSKLDAQFTVSGYLRQREAAQ